MFLLWFVTLLVVLCGFREPVPATGGVVSTMKNIARSLSTVGLGDLGGGGRGAGEFEDTARVGKAAKGGLGLEQGKGKGQGGGAGMGREGSSRSGPAVSDNTRVPFSISATVTLPVLVPTPNAGLAAGLESGTANDTWLVI